MESREIFKENKTPTFVFFFRWKRRVRRKWQVEREGERKRNGVSLELWFVRGQQGQAWQSQSICMVPRGGCETWSEPHT